MATMEMINYWIKRAQRPHLLQPSDCACNFKVGLQTITYTQDYIKARSIISGSDFSELVFSKTWILSVMFEIRACVLVNLLQVLNLPCEKCLRLWQVSVIDEIFSL